MSPPASAKSSVPAVANARRFDAVIVGGGHNGLTCAAYLAAAGLSVCVAERRGMSSYAERSNGIARLRAWRSAAS